MVDLGLKRISRRRVILVVVVLLIVFAISVPLIVYFRITTESRLAFREAKNVKLALEMIDIEYYASNRTVYNPKSINGLSDGVLERIEDLLEHDCSVTITSYNPEKRKVLGFVYTTGHYQVVYRVDAETGDSWKVNYILNILKYDGE